MVTQVEKLLRKHEHRVDDPHWRAKLKVSNPRTPRLYALPKIHKPGKLMRPICSNIGAPTSRISKWLVEEFNKLNGPVGKYVHNTYDFIDKSKNIKLHDDEILVSFDVSALFPSVPIRDALRFLKDWLEEQHIEDWMIDMYTELTNLCMQQNIFCFNNEFYQQTEGTSMGNSLSPFIANLFMCRFECSISDDPNFPRVWLRYVDDIFAVQKIDKIEDTLILLNAQYPSIKFTIEKEKHGSIPFLDIMVIRNGENLEYDIYRKPSHTPRFITGDSYHCSAQKYAAFYSMIHRMFNIPLTEERREREKAYILNLADFNNLNRKQVINIMNRKMKETFRNQETTLKEIDLDSKNKFMKIIYYPNITNKISDFLKKHNIKTALRSSHKLGNCLGTVKDRLGDFEKSGVYEIKCSGCDRKYIGMTKRKLSQRLKDHLLDARNESEGTALAKHLKTENAALGRGRRRQEKHEIKDHNMKILKEIYTYRELCVWESISIIKNRERAINDNNGMVDSQLTKLLAKQ